MWFLYIGIPLFLVGLYFYYKYYYKKTDDTIHHKVEEVVFSDDICSIIPIQNIVPNKSIILGLNQTLVLFENAKVVFTENDYKIDYNKLLPYMKKQNIIVDEISNQTENIYTCYKIQSGIIRDIELQMNNPVQLYDEFYNVLIKLKLNIRISAKISNDEAFLKVIVGFRDKLSKSDFILKINKLIESKLYSFISAYIIEKKVSFLHISLYKHDIEENVLEEINKYLLGFGVKLESLLFTDISNDEDAKFIALSKSILERSRMNIIEYSYEDKMNRDVGYHKDLVEKYSESKEETYIHVKE